MRKQSINPCTVRPPAENWPWPPVDVTFARIGIGDGETLNRTFQVVVCDHNKNPNIADNARFAITSEAKVVQALGHLFPGGELALTHLQDPQNWTPPLPKSPQQATALISIWLRTKEPLPEDLVYAVNLITGERAIEPDPVNPLLVRVNMPDFENMIEHWPALLDRLRPHLAA